VIVMTAYTTSETYQNTRRMGGTAYLTKPFANADLMDAIRRAVKAPRSLGTSPCAL
jgi:DNA-binding NtrC family response regulator